MRSQHQYMTSKITEGVGGMKTTKVFVATGLVLALLAVIAAPVLAADEPKTTIRTSVQNQTTNGALDDANAAESAIKAKTGDILKYVIEIKNNAEQSDNDKNNLSSGKLVNGLPAGVELVSDPNKREVSEHLGTIKPGETVTKQFLVKVTAGKDGETIENRGCFTGQYAGQDKAVSDCEPAFVKISLGTKEEAPAPTTPKPEEPAKEEAPAAQTPSEDLPTTGPSDIIAPVAAVTTGAFAYASRLLYLKRAQR